MSRNCVTGVITGLLFTALSVNAASSEFKKGAIPFMEKHCYECHGGKRTKGDLNLKEIKDDRKILEDHKLWRNVLQQVNTGEMPPKKHDPKPSPEELENFNQALINSMARAEAKAKPDPGHVTIRRLNRKEYNNTVRDLLAVDYNASENFPADDIGNGFDNIGDVLSISPVHLERYLDAADGVAKRAVYLTLPKPSTRSTYSIFLEPGGYKSENGTRPVTNSTPELFTKHEIKVDGDYVFRVRASATNATDSDPVQMTLLLGDKELTTVAVTNKVGKWKTFEFKLQIPAGEHVFRARFANAQKENVNRMLFINEFKVIGPADTRTEFMKRMDAIGTSKPNAERVLLVTDWFVSHAFRRPATKAEMERYTRVFEAGMAANSNKFEGGLQELVATTLCSPKFLFRAELDDRPKTRDEHPLDEYQLASRLSYFLWSTMPDEELLELAGKHKLTANLDAQVDRMLKDSKSIALVNNFGLQWLQLERLRTAAPDTTLFPSFNEQMRKAMLTETELFLGEIIQKDRSVLELVDADFTYLNRPLARHYGIEAKVFPKGPHDWRHDGDFIRVSLPDNSRGGLLTQASILTVTSNPTRTSPVKRGKWVLEQILGTPPPPPPPNVAGLEQQKQLTGTLRQKMEQHRVDPNCASCHKQMDSLGFAFENFDAVGRFRSKDADGQIDPSGALPDGSTFNGPGELKKLLSGKKELITRNLAEKLMIYGLGRGLEYYDERALKKVVADTSAQEYKFSALVKSIVKSDPFRMRRGKELIAKNETGE